MLTDDEERLRGKTSVEVDGELHSFDERLVESVADLQEVERHRARYAFASRHVAGLNVLDVACGTGYGSSMLEAAGASTVVGVDISAEAVAYARKTYASPKVIFEAADASEYAPGRLFDCVVSMETIEHLPDAEAFLVSVGGHLREDGLFIVSTPWKDPEASVPENPHHVVEWEPGRFRELLSRRFGDVQLHAQNLLLRTSIAGVRFSRKVPRFFLRGLGGTPDPNWRQHHAMRGVFPIWETCRFWVDGRAEYVIAECRRPAGKL